MEFTRLAPKTFLLALATFFLIATCLAQDLLSPVARFTVTPGVSTPIYIQTTTYAACALSQDDSTDAAQTLKAYADENGVVDFNAQMPVFELADVLPLQLQCQAGDSSTVTAYPIELRAS